MQFDLTVTSSLSNINHKVSLIFNQSQFWHVFCSYIELEWKVSSMRYIETIRFSLENLSKRGLYGQIVVT